jgi:hypothetical protein
MHALPSRATPAGNGLQVPEVPEVTSWKLDEPAQVATPLASRPPPATTLVPNHMGDSQETDSEGESASTLSFISSDSTTLPKKP